VIGKDSSKSENKLVKTQFDSVKSPVLFNRDQENINQTIVQVSI